MPLKLAAPLIEDFILEETDKTFGLDKTEEATKVRIRQATQGAHEKRQGLFDKMQREIIDDESGVTRVVATTHFNFTMLQRLETYLTLADCNIGDEKGKPLFKFKNDALDMSEAEFREAWGKLPPSVASEIHDKVVEVNYSWAFLGGGSA